MGLNARPLHHERKTLASWRSKACTLHPPPSAQQLAARGHGRPIPGSLFQRPPLGPSVSSPPLWSAQAVDLRTGPNRAISDPRDRSFILFSILLSPFYVLLVALSSYDTVVLSVTCPGNGSINNHSLCTPLPPHTVCTIRIYVVRLYLPAHTQHTRHTKAKRAPKKAITRMSGCAARADAPYTKNLSYR